MSSILLAEVIRGGHVESRHSGAFAVADAQGGLALSGGDPDRAIFPRSAVKALQALPLVASGAAQHFGLTGAELALACASHAGAPAHAETAARMLARVGQDVGCLECGTQWPSSHGAARALAAAGKSPNALHNNCSGKHAGFVCTAVAAGHTLGGYVLPDHPTMREVTASVAAVTGAALDRQVPAVDGCSIPAFRIPLCALATGFARFATGQHLPEGFAAAAACLRQAVAAHPDMLAGAGRFDTEVTAALGEAVFVKVGAEGVYCAAIPALGLGLALKCDDGGVRAAEAATAALIGRLCGPTAVLERLAGPVLKNWSGVEVGSIRACVGKQAGTSPSTW